MTQAPTHSLKELPFLETARLVVRPWKFDDAPIIEKFVNDLDIARMASSIPYPYLPGSGFGFIACQQGALARGHSYSFAITLKGDHLPIGSIGVFKRSPGAFWEIGYWVAKAYWGQGIASEAGRAVLNWANTTLNITMMVAGHFADNPASGRTLEKLGFARISDESVPMYSLAREGKAPGLMYVWPADKAPEVTLTALH